MGYVAIKGGETAIREAARVLEFLRAQGGDTYAVTTMINHWEGYIPEAALDLCAVADGRVDATVDCTTDALGPWDYLGAMLVLSEAGCVVEDLHGRGLVDVRHDARRTPVSAATPELLGALRGALLAARD